MENKHGYRHYIAPGPFHTTCITARPATEEEEEAQWDVLMMNAHPLGNAQFPGHSIKYVVELRRHAVALLCFSACAYHLADRDPRHIEWSQEQCIQRRHFVLQNSRFLCCFQASRAVKRELRLNSDPTFAEKYVKTLLDVQKKWKKLELS